MESIDLNKVMRVYSGKPGCMCGCNGTYRYMSDCIEMGGKDRGYPVDLEEVNETQVRKVVKIISEQLHAGNKSLVVDPEYVYAQVGGRVYCVYFKKGA
jgi:hypothetical protein